MSIDTPPVTHYLKSKGMVCILMIVGLCLYVPFRSVSLDDFDGYSFALALTDFNLSAQQPQPPGFPVYVGLARCARLLTDDSLAALTWVSALSGVAAMILVYAIGRQIDRADPTTGVAAALWVGLTPLGWLTAEKALSDTAGLVGILLGLWLWARWARVPDNLRRMALAALATGLALGIRPQNGLPLLLYAAFAFFTKTSPQRGWSPWLVVGAMGLCGVLVWLIPMAWATGGFGAYISQIRGHAAHVGQADSLWSMSVPLMTALRYRLLAFGDTLLGSLVGGSLFGQFSLRDGVGAGALIVVVGVGLARVDWRRRATGALALWALVTAAQVFLYEALDRPRLLLPVLPPLALLTASGWARIRRPSWLASLVVAVTALALLIQGVPLVGEIATVPAPPAQATSYVAAHYPAEETLVAAAGSFRAVQVELPRYPLVYLYRFDEEQAQVRVKEARYVVIFDRDKFPVEAVAALSDDQRWVTLEDRTFVRDRLVHTQHDQVRVQVLTSPSRVPQEALRLPADGCIDLGEETVDARHLGPGWFRPETIGGARGRWAGGAMSSTVRLVLPPAHAYRMRGRALAFPPGQVMRLRTGDEVVDELSLPQVWTEFEVQLPMDHRRSAALTTLVFDHTKAQSPFDATEGGSSDRRALTAAYDWLCFEAVGEAPASDEEPRSVAGPMDRGTLTMGRVEVRP